MSIRRTSFPVKILPIHFFLFFFLSSPPELINKRKKEEKNERKGLGWKANQTIYQPLVAAAANASGAVILHMA
jgi:hypothetical protein